MDRRPHLNRTTYMHVISGQAGGWMGTPARAALALLSWPYSGVVRLRNCLYSSGLLRAHRVEVPVLCVGNLTTGGTGKTPLVVWLYRLLRQRRRRCAILTRGYKTGAGELSDEPAVLRTECPDAPIVVNPDRAAGADAAIREYGAEVLVMDDGFQHRRLARDLDILAVDATVPFGYGRVLPAGLLREPVSGLRRAHAVVLTRCDQASGEALQNLEAAVRQVNPRLVIVRSVHAPAHVKTTVGTEIDLRDVAGRRIFAFCGIGNPSSFFRTITNLGGVLAGSHTFDDHHRYTADDLRQVREWASRQQAELLLTTQKDWTKIARLAGPWDPPALAYLTVELRLTAGAPELTALIDRVLASRIANL
jgi:tetraacyldisaccharide 4'-kinase